MKKKLPVSTIGTCVPEFVKCCALIICAILLPFTKTFSQAQLLKDINRFEELGYNEISDFTNIGAITYFISNQTELWKTDGTAAGTVRVRAFKSVGSLVPSGSLLYFAANDGNNGVELWKTNGTWSGTVMVKNIGPGAASGNPLYIINVNGVIYFTADNGVNGKEVWKTNGTASGTVIVKDIIAGKGSSGPNRLTNVNGTVYFQANDAVNGYELWKTNGTAAGTVMVKDIRTGAKAGSFPELLTNVNGTLYFVAADNTTGRELWKSNGTAAGTVRVSDIVAGSGSPAIDNSFAVNSTLFFTANDGVHGKELWKSNGTAATTVMVKDIKNGSAGADANSPMGNFQNINGKLYFTASSGSYGAMGIYVSDGTEAGTRLVTHLDSYYSPIKPELSYYNGSLYFIDITYDENSEMEIGGFFKMNLDGTSRTMIRQIGYEYYSGNLNPEMITGASYLLLGIRLTSTGGYELVRSDGTAAGTIAIKDPYVNTESSEPRRFVTAGTATYFTAHQGLLGGINGVGPQGLYRTDGTPAGTTFLRTFYTVYDPVASGSKLIFSAQDNWDAPKTLWKIENATSSPVAIRSYSTDIYRFSDVNGLVYFVEGGNNLWRTDGTSAGTIKLATFNTLYSISNYKGTAMIFAHNGSSLELWKSNGTAAGTVKLKDISTPEGRYFDHATLGVAKNLFFFAADNGTNGYEMWRSDGTPAGTFRITDFRSDDFGRQQIDIADGEVVNDLLYFTAREEAGTWGLFRTDGTVAGTTKIADIANAGHHLVRVQNDNLVIFVEGGVETTGSIWVSDLTAAGTKQVKTIFIRPEDIFPTVVNGIVYFNTSTNLWGDYRALAPDQGMWRSDGTECGTFFFNIGVYTPHPMVSLGTKLIFGAYAIKTGVEPYMYNTTSAPASPCGTPSARVAVADEANGSNEAIITFAPNPFSDELRFTVNGSEHERGRFTVYTISGAPVESVDDLEPNREYTVGRQWPLGLYIMRVDMGARSAVEKIIKE